MNLSFLKLSQQKSLTLPFLTFHIDFFAVEGGWRGVNDNKLMK
jgi:hypothetical protein